VSLTGELASVSQRFAKFSVEADAYAGPLYATLSRQVALDMDGHGRWLEWLRES
jgi:hypothetical protein